ncbi:MAG TPA: DNA gyrase inhibitor YacG [Cellvibrio sp.]|nr:DNA gyrase inhibitor YacG [Cellvibrio sp.]
MQNTTPDSNLNSLELTCPSCKKTVLWNDNFPHRPFCSDRCRLIDLGEWASESHRIAGDNLDINSEDEHQS